MKTQRTAARWSIVVASVLLGLLGLDSPQARAREGADLERGFARPPAAARPWVYWFWLNGNITREGITADLEAMERAGVGGVLIMEVDQGAPLGPVAFASPRWRELFQHVCSEAKRLGLEVNMNNDAGWNGSGGPWVKPDQSMQAVVWTETAAAGPRRFEGQLPRPQIVAGSYREIAVLAFPAPTSTYRIEDIAAKSFRVARPIAPRANGPAAPTGAMIPRDRVIDLTGRMDASGRLAWDVPEGQWTIVRFGHTSTGKENHPAPASGRGLECDKLDRAAAEAHYRAFMGRLVADVGPLAGRTLVATHIDSWEVGSQNWTPRLPEEFRSRRGYDPRPFLPAMTGRVVDSLEISERFLWDLRQTIAELLLANYADVIRELAHRDGLRLSIEAYGDGPLVDMDFAGRADEPMAEFWSWTKFGAAESCREMASAAHIHGKPILGAEAFTADDHEKWLGHPGAIKDLGDWAFCEGINRFVVHRYALQPWRDVAPGMSMGPWGLHYERTQTWWDQSRAWHDYLARCQFLLQQGRFVADILELQPEGAPRAFQPRRTDRSPSNFDGCTPEALITRVTARDGRLVLPDGLSYRVLVLPPSETMTPALLRKVKQLVDAGAVVVGPKPIKSPSLSRYPACDDEVRTLADALWGRGGIIADRTPEQVLASHGVHPDFASQPPLRYIHKQLHDVDLYFVANGRSRDVEAVASFRVAGRAPELWRPDTGRIEPAAVYHESGGVTRLPLRLEPSGSVFVLFRPAAAPVDPIAALSRDGRIIIPAPEDRATIVVRKAVYGVPGDPKRTRDVREKVQRLFDQGETRFKVARLAEGDDPAPQVVKTLVVDYTVDGRSFTATALDPREIEMTLPAPPERAADIERASDGRLTVVAWQPGVYELKAASGTTRRVAVSAVPSPLVVGGPWELCFGPGQGAPGPVALDRLVSWSDHPDPAVKAYSGRATYRTTFEAPAHLSGASRRLDLDLGRVEVMASVTLNGQNLGILWKAPYRVDATAAARPGSNQLEVSVVNLWVNRLIADEALSEDSQRNPNGTLQTWPSWLQAGRPSPTGRLSFTSWRLWKKGDAPVASGLLGPVRLLTAERVAVP